MKGDFIFASALREWENPPELPEADPMALPDEGVCPFCHEDLTWDGIDDTRAECSTIGCKYDNSKSEEANRRTFLEGVAL